MAHACKRKPFRCNGPIEFVKSSVLTPPQPQDELRPHYCTVHLLHAALVCGLCTVKVNSLKMYSITIITMKAEPVEHLLGLSGRGGGVF